MSTSFEVPFSCATSHSIACESRTSIEVRYLFDGMVFSSVTAMKDVSNSSSTLSFNVIDRARSLLRKQDNNRIKKTADNVIMSESFSYEKQKSIVYNKHLPYKDEIEEEAATKFAEIKFNLSRAVIFQELTPGILVWCNRLDTYLRLHGRSFTKEDHILLIKLLYQLLTVPNLEPQFVKGFAVVLQKLLKKQELLTREDLELPWRPLYNLIQSIRYSKLTTVGLKKFPHKFNDSIFNVVKVARCYFSIDSTKEMLLEWQPLMCPFDAVKTNAGYYLSRFLPVYLNPEDQLMSGYGLWLEEFMKYWVHCTQNIPSVADEYTRLFMRVAEANLGYIDWNPYMPQIFNLFLSSLELPVNGTVLRKGYGGSKSTQHRINAYAKWFVYMCGGKNTGLQYIEKLFNTLHSYYYPSNYGRHTQTLLNFLNCLTDHFIRRLHNERHHKPTWMLRMPDEVKITDEEIKQYVTIVKDAALLSVYSKFGSLQAAYTIQNLAFLRADIVLPPLLERTSEALETLVEPHQVVATLTCMTSVVRSLVHSDTFPEAPTHILPLLRMILPGIDPNDFRKSMCSFTLISGIIGLVPLVDCMPALNAGIEMTEIEKELCLASGQFEDFVLQLIDKCFMLVENSTLESVTDQDSHSGESMNLQEGMIGMGLGSTVQTILMQCSPEIFQSALNSIFTFISTRVLEVNVAGKMVADICRVAAKANPKATLKKMIPFMCSTIKNLASVDGIENEEHVDTELLWYLELLSEMMRCDGKELIVYRESLVDVLKLTLHLKCKKAYSRAGKLLKALLSSCTEMYTLEWYNVPCGFTLPPTEHFYIRDWGKAMTVDQVDVKWHVPDKEELDFVNELVKLFLFPELEILDAYIKGKPLTRDELHQRLQLIAVVLYGCGNILPIWSSERVQGLNAPTMIGRDRAYYLTKFGSMVDFQCCVTRKEVALKLHDFYEHMLKTNEDDTKAFRIIAKIYDFLLLHHGTSWNEFNIRWKSASTVKKALADKLHGNKLHVRAVLVERIQLQHDMRALDRHSSTYTITDEMLIHDLLKMGTSHYTEVRIDSQKVLFAALEMFDYGARSILPKLLDNLKSSPETSHEQLKGTLYIMHYPRIVYLITHYWDTMKDTWPRIIKADQSEKPSIVSLINRLIKNVESKFDTLGLERKVNIECRNVAVEFLQTTNPRAESKMADANIHVSENIIPDDVLMSKSVEALQESNSDNKKLFSGLLEELVLMLEDTNIHWRCGEICIKLLTLLFTDEMQLSERLVQLIVRTLIHDSLTMRMYAVKGVVSILHLLKPNFNKQQIDYQKFSVNVTPDNLLQLQNGDNRQDNQWMQFQPSRKPNSQSDFDNASFVDKTHWGYTTWPLELKTYTKQDDLSSRELNKYELVFITLFSDSQFLERFFHLHSLEIKKGEDRFNHRHFYLYKGLFRNFGCLIFPQFKSALESLLNEHVESKHRCATEIVAGLIRGSKNWKYEELESLWTFLCPLIKDVFTNKVITEVRRDWSIAFITATESRDPNRFHALFSMLLDNPLSGVGGSLGDTSRLMLLQNTIAQQEWRISHIYHDLFTYLKQYLSHPYQNVRDRIGSVLSYILMCDVQYACATTQSPRIRMFVDSVKDDLVAVSNQVQNASEDAVNVSVEIEKMEIDTVKIDGKTEEKMEESSSDSQVEKDEESKRKDRVLKTVLAFLINNSYTMQPINKDICEIIPILIPLEAREDDPEIVKNCRLVFAMLASKLLPEDVLTDFLQSILEVCSSKSWNSRKTALNYLKLNKESSGLICDDPQEKGIIQDVNVKVQIMLFYNLFSIERDDIKKDVEKVIVERLKDEQLEVREVAGTLLSGMVHYGYFEVTQDLITNFTKLARKKIKEKRHGIEISAEDQKRNAKNLRLKHGGILGLSSLVLAFPYDVPLWMPQVLLELGDYLHASPQVQTTVKKTLSDFRRTHHDNWHMHRQKFTGDQLSVLTDLLVSPSYYA